MKPLTSATPHVIIMVGIPGAGKSTFAEHFADTFQAPIVSHHHLNKVADINETTTSQVTNVFLDELLKTRSTLIYDGPTHSKVSRNELVKKVSLAGYEPLLVWVQTESLEAKRRAIKKLSDNSQLTSDGFDAAIKKFTPPTLTEKPVVISGKHTYASQLKIVLKRLAGEARTSTTEEPRSRPSGRTITIR